MRALRTAFLAATLGAVVLHLGSIAMVRAGAAPTIETSSRAGLLAALLALLLVAFGAPSGDLGEWRGAAKLGLAGWAVLAPVSVVAAHHRGLQPYPTLVALVLGAAVAAVAAPQRTERAFDAGGGAAGRGQALLLGLGIAVTSLVLPRTPPWTWIAGVAAALLLPGVGASLLALPRQAGWATRLSWAGPLALGLQLPLLIWLDLFEIPARRPMLVALGPAIALVAWCAGALRRTRSSPNRASEPTP